MITLWLGSRITSSPSFISRAFKDKIRASVPLLVEMQCFVFMYLENFFEDGIHELNRDEKVHKWLSDHLEVYTFIGFTSLHPEAEEGVSCMYRMHREYPANVARVHLFNEYLFLSGSCNDSRLSRSMLR